ncbi:MAG: DMT family transporter [Candidatus Micrarchaeota archaeon]
MNRGTSFALLVALISGISVFVNSFGVSLSDPFVYATLKNSLVAVFLVSGILLFGKLDEIKKLNRKQFGQLALIGLIGGGIPFLLFFYGLSLGMASISSFIFRSLFVFAAIASLVILREKISKSFVLGAAIIFAGNFLLIKESLGFGLGQLLVLGATILWAIEYSYSKKVMATISPNTSPISPNAVAFGRMFFGSLFLLGFLAFTGKFQMVFEVSQTALLWTVVASGFLLSYVFFWYNSLKHISVSRATSILVLGGPITALLNFVFIGKAVALGEAISLLIIVIGVIVAIWSSAILRFFCPIEKTSLST